MSTMRYTYDYNGMRYTIDAPTGATAADLAAIVQGGAQPLPPPPPAAPPPAALPPAASPMDVSPTAALKGTRDTAPVKEPKEGPALPWEYFTDRENAIRRDREYRAYLQDKMQRADVEGLKTQTGFFDRLGDLFTRGELNVRSGIKDVEAAIETDPTLKKQFQQEARRFAADKGIEIKGATTEQDVKDNFLRNAIPYIIEKGAESLPQMLASTTSLGTLGLALPTNVGGQAREAAELQGRQDVTAGDVAKVTPGALAVTALDTIGLGGILATPAKTALGRIGKAALIEGSTEAIQSAIEYANPRLVTGSDIDAGDMFEQAAFGALAGGGIGGGLRGVGEVAAAPFKSKEATEEETKVPPSADMPPAVRAEYLNVFQAEVASAMQADPNLTQRKAVEAVLKNAGQLYAQATVNVLGAAEAGVDPTAEAGEVDVDTGVDVNQRAGAGVPPAGVPVPSGVVPGESAALAARGVGEPDTGVPAATGIEAAGDAALTKTQIDPVALPIYEASTRKDRVAAAIPIINNIIDTTYGDVVVPKTVATQMATQMAQRAARQEPFNPTEIVQSVLVEKGLVPKAAAPEVTGERYAALEAAYTIPNNKTAEKMRVIAPVVADIFTRVTGLDTSKLPEGDTKKAYSSSNTRVFNAVLRGEAVNPETIVQEQIAQYKVPLPETAAPVVAPTPTPTPTPTQAAPKMAAPKMAAPKAKAAPKKAAPQVETPPAPTYTYADVIKEADSLVASDPELVQPGQLTAQQFQQFSIQAEQMPALAEQGVEVPNPIELRQDLYKMVGREAPPLEATAAPEPEPEYTPQQIAENLIFFSGPEAKSRGYEPNTVPYGMFTEGARDVARGAEPMADEDILAMSGQEGLDPYRAGQQWAQNSVAAAQAPAAKAEPAAKAAPKKAAPTPVEAPLPESYAPILQEYQAIVEKPTPEATDRLKASTVRDIPLQGSKMTMSVVQAPDGTLLALPGRDMILGWQRQLQGELAKDLRSQTIDQFYDYEGLEVPLQVTRPAVVDASGNVVQRGILGKAPTAKSAPATSTSSVQPGGLISGVRMDIDKYRGGTLSDLLEEIFANLDGKFSQYDMYLAGRISTLLNEAERAGLKVKLNILQKEGEIAPTNVARGIAYGAVSTDLTNNTIDVYLRSPEMGEDSAGNTSEVVLHEALHAVSKAFILAVRRTSRGTPKIVKFVNDLNEVRNAFVAHFNARVRSGAELSEFEQSILKKSSNALADLDEFLTWGMTNANAQEYLRGIEVGPGKNLFQRFVAMFKSMLNIPDGDTSALSRLIEIVNPLFEATEADYKAVMGTPATGTAEARAGAKTPKPKVVSNGKQVTLTPAQTRMALEKAEGLRRKLNRIQKRIANTNRDEDVLSAQVELAKLVRGDKDNIALLRGAVDTLDVNKWRVILPALSTEDIFRILKGRIEGLTEADKIVRNDIVRFTTKEYITLSEELEQVADFLKKYPKVAQVLSDLQFATVAYQVDPSKADTPEEYADKFDKKTKVLKQKRAAEQDPKKQGSLDTQIKNRFNDIKSVYEGGGIGTERVAGWRDLARPEYGANKGKEIFKLIRDAHRRDLENSYQALRQRLMETKEGEKLDDALEKLEAQFKPAREQAIYFPAMRFGSFYARIGTGANSIFNMFETETQRNQYVRLMKERAKEATNKEDYTVSETGNVEDLRNKFEGDAGGPLKEVLDLFEGNPKDISALRGQVFDLWLQTMSQGDMRKHMAPRKLRAGYSTNILKNFASFRRSSINSVKRAKFGYKLRNELERAKDFVKDQPDKNKMDVFIKELELRIMGSFTPTASDNSMWNKALNLGNKFAFYQYLANPKTAFIQLTQLHIVALPMLSQKYGTDKAAAALAKYGFSSLGGFVASELKAIPRPGNNWSFDWEQPNLLDNPISTLKKESDPELYEVLSEGWNEGRDINLWMETFANEIGGYGAVDPKQQTALQELAAGRPVTASLRGATFAFEAMGALMHQMERVNREATYMATLELAYREGIKAGKPHAIAKQEAIEAAKELTLAATFDFSAYNKPRILTQGIGRVAGQFYSFPYMLSSLLVRKMATVISKPGVLEPGERKAAAQIAAGTLINLGMYAGITGLPFYGFTKLVGTLFAALLDDDDEEGGFKYVDKDGNLKATYDWDWWFRNVWIPRHFGADGTVPNLLGLDADTAEILARSIEKGPISAITDIDLSNSIALNFLFFLPEESRQETAAGKVGDTIISLFGGAAGSGLLDYAKAYDDLVGGYTGRALEKLPKLVSNVFRASRFADQGQRSYQGELTGMDADFWSSDKQILLSLGFNSTEAAQRQQQNYESRNINKRTEQARNRMLDTYRQFIIEATLKGYDADMKAKRLAIRDEIREFNEEYPNAVIGDDTLLRVQATIQNDMRKSEQFKGVPYDVKGSTPYLRDMVKRREAADAAR